MIDPARLERLTGFGMAASADAYVFRPTRLDQVQALFAEAQSLGKPIVLRGAGQSYGDAALLQEAIALDCSRMRRVLDWDPDSGVLTAEPGCTIGDLWRTGLEDGWWPPVVSGTSFPTLGGAVGMNIHGKNAWKAGPIGSHLVEIELLTPNGEQLRLTPEDTRFWAVPGSAGLLGFVSKVVLQMKRVSSGDLRVLGTAPRCWDEQFEVFQRLEGESDYMVSWVDCFARGRSAGRGQFHAAWHVHESSDWPASLKSSHQELPDTILGWLPKSMVWRLLRPLNRRFGMRVLNAAKDFAGSKLADGKLHHQSLVGFSFLLDYVPNWRNAYLPGGFIQYQSFVPAESAQRVFAEQVRLQQSAKLESFLGVLKRHKPDPFLLSHGVDGYSLAMDFKVTERNRRRLWELCHQMNDLVVAAGGRFYLAKDSTMRPSDVVASFGAETLSSFRALKAEMDPRNLLRSSLAERLGLV